LRPGIAALKTPLRQHLYFRFAARKSPRRHNLDCRVAAPPGVIMCWYVSVHHASPCHAPCCPTPHTAPRNCEQHAGIPPQVWNTRLYKQEADCSDNEGVEEVPTLGEGDKKFASFLVFGCSVTLARTVVLGPQRCVRQFPFVVLLLCVATSDLLVM
jgi:hypothetical protein